MDRKMKNIALILLFVLLHLNSMAQVVYKTETLKIEKISKNTFVHISTLVIPNYGTFPCNGLLFTNNNEALVVDTPIGNEVSKELIEFIKKDLNCKSIIVIPSHFHMDCLSGLDSFHSEESKSFANNKTIELAKKQNYPLPINGIKKEKILTIGKVPVTLKFFGEGHTKDNIVAHIPSENVLFGGCLIKEVGAGYGNLDDANIDEWPKTVSKIKSNYPDLKIVIPGHGLYGNTELLDFTIALFSKD